MRYRLVPTVIAVLFSAIPSLQAQNRPPFSAEQLREEQAYTLGLQAYVYGYPLVEMYRLRYDSAFNPVNKLRKPINVFRHRRELIDHTYSAVLSPNSDTIYSAAFLDLSPEPMILHVPDANGRYYVFQFLDFYTNNFASVGMRTTGTKKGDFLIAGPGWTGAIPDGLKRIDCPTNSALLIGRILVDGKEDMPAVHRFQDACALTPLGAWGTAGQPSPQQLKTPPTYHRTQVMRFFEFLDIALSENPPPARDTAFINQLAPINVGLNRSFHVEALDPATAKGLARAIEVGRQMMSRPPQEKGMRVNGWYLPAREIGVFGDDYLLRAEVAMKWIFALPVEEAVYFIGEKDAEGIPLTGQHHYVLRFEKGQSPPVDAFWSITMYRMPERLLADNPIHRYAVGDRTKELVYQPDGSLELYIQHDAPDKERLSNWLPAPAAEFNLILRAYLPRQEIHDGRWKVPAVKRAQ
jgi:hypothetical protein